MAFFEEDFFQLVHGFFSSSFILRKLNYTNIALILKVQQPSKVTQFRPFSLCNFAYKVISQVMINRLKGCLIDLVLENQGAFVGERQIQDNVFITQQAFHYLRKKKKGRKFELALKTDMMKAYDKVKWDFLDLMLRRLGFDSHWVQLMQCVSTVSYRVIINGDLGVSFNLSHGL